MVRTGRNRIRLTAAAFATTAALATGAAVTPATAATPQTQTQPEAQAQLQAQAQSLPLERNQRYVALGDSYASGPAIPRQTDLTCLRSSANYPSLIRKELGVTDFQDVSCMGARTDDMWRQQRDTRRPPQLDAVRGDTRLVTISVGGNDIDFDGILKRCTHPSSPIPDGNPCQRHFSQRGTDELDKRIDDTAPKVAALLKAVHKKAPRARVAVVGYPAIIGDDARGCRESLRVADGDVPYLRGTLRRLNAMLRREAFAQGDLYVNTNATTAAHSACRPFADRWIEGIRSTRASAAFHPNAKGEKAMSEAVLDALVFGPKR
ncbi:SGNH/GDSL hydrolase family protein [Streptomyces griseocarneus]|uniref:SGNH/GDSL hydrolase family protein n=1 Tax=Streptomyces griseocarneus TaxID=51201 RepID=UPI00167E30EC|nr:SGNH/GDSL hydrolase family protein [Streptomyces griseocarneus]MBZ6473087.1 SGNH/GDSL hydrolase family protein [Streptomyces griseocarneus]GHG59802.1 lipase [Streptomyces griseocarneus]